MRSVFTSGAMVIARTLFRSSFGLKGNSKANAPFLPALLLAVCASGPGLAETRQCSDEQLRVTGSDTPVSDRACLAAEHAKELLSECGIVQKAAIEIQITEDITSLAPHCMAEYDCATGRIEILSPQQLEQRLVPDTTFSLLPPDALFDSLIVHEMTHALLDQTECAADVCRVDHEYLAYAMQLQSLSPEHRALLVEGRRSRQPVDIEEINPMILAMAPDFFAARAWVHFSAPENGCAIVDALLDGKLTFSLLPE